MNLTTPRKVTNNDKSGSHCFFKNKQAIIMKRDEGKKRKKRKNLEGTLKFRLQYYQYYKKNLDETNPTTPKNIIKVDWSGLHLPSKASEYPLDDKCSLLYSPLIFFLDVEFVSSRYF
jgi:hypothetical protein